MDKNKKDQRDRQSDSKSIKSSVKGKIKNTQTFPDYLVPEIPTVPVIPVEKPDHTSPEPGVNEPKKNDPTHIDKPPSIFNNK